MKRFVHRVVTKLLPLHGLFEKYAFSSSPAAAFFNPFYFSRRELYDNIKELGGRLSGAVLDVGCGTQPYRHLLNCTQYRGLELDTPENRKKKKCDFFYDGVYFPLPDGSFDSVFCTQVLEHVFTPELFVREIARVLKPGGKLLLTVPFVWDEHEQPHDCARYSSFGLRALLERNGFEIIEQRKTCDDATVLFQLLNCFIYKKIIGNGSAFRWGIVNVFTAIVNINGLFFNLILPGNSDLYLDNVVYAVRRDPPGELPVRDGEISSENGFSA